MSQQAKLKSLFDILSTRHAHVAITTVIVGALTDILSPVGGWYVSTGIAALCVLFLLLILVNREWVSQRIERSPVLSQWIGGSLPCDKSCLKAPAVQYLAIGMLVFGYTSYTTKANADEGGALASNFDQVRSIQSMMGMIASIQKDVGKISATVNEIDSTTRSIQEGVSKIDQRLDQAANANRDPAKQLQAMGTSWDPESFIKALDANDIKRLGLFLDGGFVYTSREASDRVSSFFEADKFSTHLPALKYLRSRGVDFVGEFNPRWDERDDGASSPLGRAALTGSEKAVQWLLEGANASSLQKQKYKYVLFQVGLLINENLKTAAEYGLDRHGPEDRAEQLATLDRNVRLMKLLVARGTDKTFGDYHLYQEVLVYWLHLKYEFREDHGLSAAYYFGWKLNESDSLVLADRVRPLLAVLAPSFQDKKAALDKAVKSEFVTNFNRWAIAEREQNLEMLADGRVSYLKSEAEKAEYQSKYQNEIRDLKAKRDVIRDELKV